MSKKIDQNEIFSFEEAMNLFHVGAHGFIFKNALGGKFTSSLNHTDRLKIEPIEKKPESIL